ARLGSVPEDVDVARAVGSDRPAAIEARRRADHIALRLEGRPRLVEARVEHGGAATRGFRHGLVRAVPGDVSPAILPQGEVGAAASRAAFAAAGGASRGASLGASAASAGLLRADGTSEPLVPTARPPTPSVNAPMLSTKAATIFSLLRNISRSTPSVSRAARA